MINNSYTKNIEFAIMHDKERRKILTFETLFGIFAKGTDKKDYKTR